MTALGDQIQRARKKATLSVESLAGLADVGELRLRAIEEGRESATPDESDRVARAFGVSRRDLFAGRAAESPMHMLLKAARIEGRGAIDALIETRAIDELGEFQRWVRDAADLEGLTQATRRALPTALHGDRERQAKLLRLYENNHSGPIPSMRRFVESLGVRVFFTSPSHLHDQIDGASTLLPRPAILVNLVVGGRCWWRTRMTLAHELAHVLFDLEGDQRTLFSPHVGDWAKARTTGRWGVCEGFDDIEVEADKFAACLLAPRDEVTAVVGHLDPTGNPAVSAVGERFGVGKLVAINRLQVCFKLSQEERQRMIDRSKDLHWETHEFDGDVVDEGEGLRTDALRDLAARALTAGRIDRLRAHELLRVPLHLPLPLRDVPDALCTPVVTPERHARGVARRFVARTYGRHDLVDGPAERVGEAWVVTMMRWAPGEPTGAPERVLTVRGEDVVGDRAYLPEG